MPKINIVDGKRKLNLEVPEMDIRAWASIYAILYPETTPTSKPAETPKVTLTLGSKPVSDYVDTDNGMTDEQVEKAASELALAFNRRDDAPEPLEKVSAPEPPARRPQYGDKVLCNLHCEKCGYEAKPKVPYGDRWVRCPYCGTHLHMYPAVYGVFGEADEDGFYYKAVHEQTEEE